MNPPDALTDLLAEVHERLERGEPVDRGALLARHPELADELRSWFTLSDLLDDVAEEAAVDLIEDVPERIGE